MLFKLRILFSTIAIAFALYGLVSEDPPEFIMTVMLLSLGAMMFVMGFSEYNSNKKASAYFSFIAAVFVGFVSIYSLF
ncbi:YczI family protein [Rossellomorea sp. NPDC071047]|uniref:YczI family protein n=1 Tax=Rossellomorea sp. NPDC071047 TaxID=3390675 RepID=UPI003D081164